MNNPPMSNTTPRTDAAAFTAVMGSFPDGSTQTESVVDSDFARQLETELASVQLELGATKGELAAANASKDAISKRAEAIRCELVESTKREAQLREALERCDPGLDYQDKDWHDGHVACEISWGDLRAIRKAIATFTAKYPQP